MQISLKPIYFFKNLYTGIILSVFLILIVSCETQAQKQLKTNILSKDQITNLEKDSCYIASGIASRYHPSLHGKLTASGQPYDSTLLTAAHRTLKLGDQIVVVNPKNGKYIELTITDRGPFARSRIIDLSQKAADSLSISSSKGIGRVIILNNCASFIH